MMGFLKLIWSRGRPSPPDSEAVSRNEIERTFAEYDRKLAELNEAMRALRDHEPDYRLELPTRWNPDAP